MEVRGQIHAPAALSQGKNYGTHCIWAWIGPRADVNNSEKRKISSSTGIQTLDL